jgi:hypothetical protein
MGKLFVAKLHERKGASDMAMLIELGGELFYWALRRSALNSETCLLVSACAALREVNMPRLAFSILYYLCCMML